MKHEKPLWARIYFDSCYTEICRAVGYAGITFRDLQAKLEEWIKQYGHRAETAVYHLVTHEGQMTVKPPPLAQVTLRAEARKACWGLLGPPPEHPWFEAFKTNAHIPYPWEKAEQQPAEPEPKQRTKKKK